MREIGDDILVKHYLVRRAVIVCYPSTDALTNNGDLSLIKNSDGRRTKNKKCEKCGWWIIDGEHSGKSTYQDAARMTDR